MSDVTEKLAAAGFGPRTEKGDEILVFIPGNKASPHSGICLRHGKRFGKTWDDGGKNFCGTGVGWDLVPLPSTEPERLSDTVLEDYASLGECQAKAMATEVIASRRQLAELREQMTLAEARTAEQIRDKTRIANEYEEQAKSLREQVAELTQKCKDHVGGKETLREQVATLTRERDEAREMMLRLQECIDNMFRNHDGTNWFGLNYWRKRFSDARGYCQQPAEPSGAGEIVPWTSYTRPRGTIWIRLIGQTEYEWIVTCWRPDGCEDLEGDVSTWRRALNELEWSRDGITWSRCGTVAEGGAENA